MFVPITILALSLLVIGAYLYLTSNVPTVKTLTLVEIEPSITLEEVPQSYIPRAESWRTVKFDERNSFHYPSHVPRVPEVIFVKNVTANIGGKLATPLVEEDKIFLADGEGVYALSRSDGSLIWGVDIGVPPNYESVALAGRKIYWGEEVSKWKVHPVDRRVGAYGLGKYLYIGTTTTPGGRKPPLLIALDKNSGDVKWEVEIGSARDTTISTMIIVRGRLVAGTANGGVYCLSEDGRLLWNVTIKGIVRGLAADNGLLIATSEGAKDVIALKLDSGEQLWSYEGEGEVSTPSWIGDKIVFLDSRRLKCLSRSGELLWESNVIGLSDVWTNSMLTVDNHKIYLSAILGEGLRGVLIVDSNGMIVGNYTISLGGASTLTLGNPVSTEDLVILPFVNDSLGEIQILWRGLNLLYKLKHYSEEAFRPVVSVGYGEIYVVFSESRSRQVLYKLGDLEPPRILGVKVELTNQSLQVKVTARDERSSIYKVLLAYSYNGSEIRYVEMEVGRRYVMEPIGGYGFSEEEYVTSLGVEADSKVEFYVVVVDKAGNVSYSEIYAYKIVYSEK